MQRLAQACSVCIRTEFTCGAKLVGMPHVATPVTKAACLPELCVFAMPQDSYKVSEVSRRWAAAARSWWDESCCVLRGFAVYE